MLAILAFSALVALASPTPRQSATETHTVRLINRCGQGQPTLEYFAAAGSSKIVTGDSFTFDHPVNGGLAWITGAFGCGDENAENCGSVEFGLVNGNSSNGYQSNAASYDLMNDGGDQDHAFKYKMDYVFDGCDPNPAAEPCNGPTQDECPQGDFAVDGGIQPLQIPECVADNVGLTITFC